MKQYYNELIQVAEELKIHTNNKINLYKTGRFSKTALKHYFTEYFNKLNLSIEPITFEEAIFINEASCGAIMIAKKYKGPAYFYDIISAYPSIMKDHKMLFSIKQGEFKTLTQKEFNQLPFFQYGIFKAKVQKSDIDNINKCFRFNPKNYYTHIDLGRAKELGLNIQIQEDNAPNFLYYARDKLVSGKILFGDYVDYFYEMKKNNVKGAKLLLNCLWGALTECNIKKVKFNIEKGFNLKEDNDYIDIKPISDTKMIAYIVNPKKYYEYDLARIKPFILAKCRKNLSTLIQPHINNVVYSHTDSIISKIKLDIKTGNNIGELKYEGFCQDFWIKNINTKAKKEIFIK